MADLLSDFRKIPAFADLPDEHLSWLAAQAQELALNSGEVLVHEGAPADAMFVLIEGETEARTESIPESPVFTQLAPMVTGMLPYSRMTQFTVTLRAVKPSRFARISTSVFPEMLSRMPLLGQRLVGILADRVRESTRQMQQREKLAALGKISAGLAHELNNPAAAGKRAAAALREAFDRLEAANLALDQEDVPREQRMFTREIELKAKMRQAGAKKKDALAQSDAEEAVGSWMDANGIKNAWTLAPIFADADIGLPELERFKSQTDRSALNPAANRIGAVLEITRLLQDIENSTGRISELVRAIKEYSFMDQAPTQDVDVARGIESTLVILTHKLKRGVTIVRNYDSELPRIFSFGSELNQVWTNLIDNAVDAMKGQGELRIRTAREGEDVLVEIVDNGPGIPTEIQSRIFDPFFTTKPIGDGTGLGLDTVYRIVRKHHGTINFVSRPGYTCFRVRLPIKQGRTVAEPAKA